MTITKQDQMMSSPESEKLNQEQTETGTVADTEMPTLRIENENKNFKLREQIRDFFSRKLDRNNKKKTRPSIDIEELLNKPGPKLPMVKFDDEGDFFKEPLEIKKDDENSQNDENKDIDSHIIYIGESFKIDTKKVKKYLKSGFKFAFSQIGLAGLVVGYVILGALIFMKIESGYEKENQNKIERNREEFFENVKITAENMFNEYLKSNFHMTYNNYRNEEMQLKEAPLALLPQAYIPSAYISPYNNNNEDRQNISIKDSPATKEDIKSVNDLIKFDRKSHDSKLKPSWFVELNREYFYKEIKEHLRILLIENDKIEDKDKQTMLVREDVWNYPNAMLYSATVITTIGNIFNNYAIFNY